MTSLRNYQIRLSNFALFRSAIICLPTGSGKTLIAATCLKHDIEVKRMQDNKRGALFLVPTCLLVTQQAKALHKETGLKVAEYMGGAAKPNNFDILVSTPAAFLTLSNYHEYGLQHFSRVVFDEIHHVVKRHPYRLIARKLVSIKPHPPLILGLTASLTYATNAVNIKQAIENICYEFAVPIDSVISATKEELRTDGYHAVDIKALVSTPSDFLSTQENDNNINNNLDKQVTMSTTATTDNAIANDSYSSYLKSSSSIQELPGHVHENKQDFLNYVTNRYSPPLHPVTLVMMDVIQRLEVILKQRFDSTFQSPLFELNENAGDWSEYIINRYHTKHSTYHPIKSSSSTAATTSVTAESLYYHLEHFYEATRLMVNSRQLGLEMAAHYLKMMNVLSSSTYDGFDMQHNSNNNDSNDNSTSSRNNDAPRNFSSNITDNNVMTINSILSPLYQALDQRNADFNRLEHLKEVILQEYYRHHSDIVSNCSEGIINDGIDVNGITNNKVENSIINTDASESFISANTSHGATAAPPSNASGLRCIIFVQQRISTHILHHFIENDIDFQYLHIHSNIIYAAKTPATTRLSINKTQIAQRIHQFSTGELQILIATSVAEEGMDIPAANCVIRFDAIQTPVSLVQSRGRARHENSNFHVLQHNIPNNNSHSNNSDNANNSSHGGNSSTNFNSTSTNTNKKSNATSASTTNSNTTSSPPYSSSSSTVTKSRTVASLEAAEKEQMRVIHACSTATASADYALTLKRKREVQLNRDRSARVYLERYVTDPVKYPALNMLKIYSQKIAAELSESIESAMLTIPSGHSDSSSGYNNTNNSNTNSYNDSIGGTEKHSKSLNHMSKGWKVTFTLLQYDTAQNESTSSSNGNDNTNVSFSSISECKKKAKSQVAEMFMNHLVSVKLK